MNEVACALLAHGAPHGAAMAVMPLGTANDFAAALGISMASERACAGRRSSGAWPHAVLPTAATSRRQWLALTRQRTRDPMQASSQRCAPFAARPLSSHSVCAPPHPRWCQDPATALALALDPSSARPIDVGLLNGHPFVNVALVRGVAWWGWGRWPADSGLPAPTAPALHLRAQAGGVSAVPQEELSSPLKRLLGPLGIAIHGAWHAPPPP